MHPPKVTIREQVNEAKCELQMREFAYPDCIHSGEMTEAVADEKIRRQQAIVTTLEWIEANSATIKAVHEQLCRPAIAELMRTFPEAQRA